MNDLRTPLARAKGLGTAKEGVGHWWTQRLSSLLLIPLVLWFGFAVASLPQATRIDMHDAGHMIPMERPKAFTGALEEFGRTFEH